ncbi:hypothetical protein BZB76_6053 [Actinomadura pelletieri DSM 43383]|uniref:Uncharacterized protein n=1 Tax=Actinomadura pelletieri DSM 43383 TaxID=1120940 RepID=A0A495QB57_9ACTN|nr:hypothetical protein [Actinomadura pelletieri]RKS68915.1 hypothetical protein BZB76_6053 [Actinomadura pelletieri DSM 43383]
MSVRRLAAFAAAVLAVAVLAGCAGGGPAPPQRAWFRVVILPDGNALLDLHAAGRLRSDADVRALARRVAAATFPGAWAARARTERDRGLPFARVEIRRAYRTGPAPSLRIDTAAAVRVLAARGFRDTTMRLRLPSVPATVRANTGHANTGQADTGQADTGSSGPLAWRLRADAPPPVVRVELRPRPVRWLAAMALPVLGAAGVGLGFFVRRRILALPAAGLSVAAAIIAVAVPAGRQGDGLGVAGLCGGTALRVATIAPLTAVPLALPAVLLLATMVCRLVTGPDVRSAHEARPADTGVFW